ncbi:MAG: kelch repeat-containing protein [Candidatus Bathyarchaeia archaeon]
MNRFVRIVTVAFVTLLIVFVFMVFWVEAAAEDAWITKAPVPSTVWGVAAANGKIYAFARNITYEYDPLADVWTTKNHLPFSMYGHALAVYQNKIYIFESDGRTYVYDPATDTWETKTPMPTPRTQLTANVVNGKIYLIGGRTGGQYTITALNEVYDIATDSWTTKASIPNPVTLYASAVVDGKIYIIGGQNEFTQSVNLALVQIYDPATDTWSFGAPIPKIVWNAAAIATTGVWAPKRIYVIGGIPDKSMDGTTLNQVYNPENDSWTLGKSMPTARFQLHVAVVNDMIYAMGGLPYFNLHGIWCPENEQYTPMGYGTVPPAVAVISPENATYNATSVSLVFTVNKPVVWMGYSLDGQETVTIIGNTTLAGLANGVHNITVYARDEFGNTGASEPITFSIETPFPILLIATVSGIAVLIIGIGFSIYYKKHCK